MNTLQPLPIRQATDFDEMRYAHTANYIKGNCSWNKLGSTLLTPDEKIIPRIDFKLFYQCSNSGIDSQSDEFSVAKKLRSDYYQKNNIAEITEYIPNLIRKEQIERLFFYFLLTRCTHNITTFMDAIQKVQYGVIPMVIHQPNTEFQNTKVDVYCGIRFWPKSKNIGGVPRMFKREPKWNGLDTMWHTREAFKWSDLHGLFSPLTKQPIQTMQL